MTIPRQYTSHFGDTRPKCAASGALYANNACATFEGLINGVKPKSESKGSLSGLRRILPDLRLPWGKLEEASSV